jgi:hypothetical protein
MRSSISAAATAVLLSATASATIIGGANTIDPVTVHGGTVEVGSVLSYVSGGNGVQGTASGGGYAITGDTTAAALAAVDHIWAQYDPGIWFSSAFATSSVLAIPAIDHGWTIGNTGEFWEPFEFKVFGCAVSGDPTSCIEGIMTDVWTKGVDDAGASKNADDWTSRWAFNSSYNYFLVTSGDRLEDGPWSAGEGEIDALAIQVPEPSTLALIGMALLSMFGFGMMRRRADI